MKQVRPGLYLGNQFDAFYFLEGKHTGVTHILSVVPLCRKHDFAVPLEDPRDKGVMYKIAAELEHKCPDFSGEIVRKIIPLEDHKYENLLEHRFIDDAVEKGIVLVHCRGGISRSASVVTAYLMWKDKRSANEALATLKQSSPTAKPRETFMKQLQTFESSGFVVKAQTENQHKQKAQTDKQQKQKKKPLLRTCTLCHHVAPFEEFLL